MHINMLFQKEQHVSHGPSPADMADLTTSISVKLRGEFQVPIEIWAQLFLSHSPFLFFKFMKQIKTKTQQGRKRKT